MHRTAADGKADDLFAAGKDGYEDEDVGAGDAGTLFQASDRNVIQEEISRCVEQIGGTLLEEATTTTWPDDYEQLWRHGTRAGTSHFGDGSDGPINVNGGDETLTKDTYASSIDWTTQHDIITNGFRLFCNGTVTGHATLTVRIRNNGADAVADAAGAGGAQGTLVSGAAGGAGLGAGGAAGSSNTDALGGDGGAGGAGTGGGGGAAGTATDPAATDGGVHDLAAARNLVLEGPGGRTPVEPGAGGGGGGGDGLIKGGGGGGGSGSVVAFLQFVILNNLVIEANGGDGAAGLANDCGGGGGGGGGNAVLGYRASDDDAALEAAVSVAGGAGGASGGGAGVAGSAGDAGTKLIMYA
jgi:hypothetical protein